MDELIPDKWKLYHCTATSGMPDHPLAKWRDADILKLLEEISVQAERIRKLEADLAAERERNKRLSEQVAKLSEPVSDEEEKRVKELWPNAHLAPMGEAQYPNYWIIRAERREWTQTLGAGSTPQQAWSNAEIGRAHV